MEATAGCLMVARSTFSSDNPDKLNYSKGDHLVKLDARAGAADPRWWFARSSDGTQGKVDATRMELQLSAAEVAAQVAALREEMRDLLPAIVARKESALYRLYMMMSSHAHVRAMIHAEYGDAVVPALRTQVFSIPAATCDYGLGWATLTLHRLVSDPSELGDEVALQTMQADGVLPCLLRRVRLHQDGEGNLYDKAARKVASASCDLLASLVRSAVGEGAVTDEAIALFIRVVGDKGNAVHRQPANARAYHVPSVLGYLSALSMRPALGRRLVDAGVIATLEGVTAEQDTPAAVNDALGALVVLRRTVFWSRRQKQAQPSQQQPTGTSASSIDAYGDSSSSSKKKTKMQHSAGQSPAAAFPQPRLARNRLATPSSPALLPTAATPYPGPISQSLASETIVLEEAEMGETRTDMAKAVEIGDKEEAFDEASALLAEEAEAVEEVGALGRSVMGDGGGHVMISYNWRNQPLALKLKNALEAAGYRIWIDLDKMGTNVRRRWRQQR